MKNGFKQIAVFIFLSMAGQACCMEVDEPENDKWKQLGWRPRITVITAGMVCGTNNPKEQIQLGVQEGGVEKAMIAVAEAIISDHNG